MPTLRPESEKQAWKEWPQPLGVALILRQNQRHYPTCGPARDLLLEQCPGLQLRPWTENLPALAIWSAHWGMEANVLPKAPRAGPGLPCVWCEKGQVPEGFGPPQGLLTWPWRLPSPLCHSLTLSLVTPMSYLAILASCCFSNAMTAMALSFAEIILL